MEKKEPKIKILVACHKADPAIRQNDIYMPIQVGKALHPELDLGFQGDDTGDNISEKNGSYCELTAMYWAWKNLPKDVDIVGLCHYRRYFKFRGNIRKAILKALETNDVIAICPYHHIAPNIHNLAELITWEDVTLMIDTICRLLPNSKECVLSYFYNSNHYSVFNMMILKREKFEEYCDVLFRLLSYIEGRLIGQYPWRRLNRNIGYIGEALMGFLFKYLGYKVGLVECDNLSVPVSNRSYHILRSRISTLRKYIAFRLLYIRPQKKIMVNRAALEGMRADGTDLINWDF